MSDNKENKVKISVPIREELKGLTSAIAKMMKVFRDIKNPIQESFDKVPTTTQHLENVTEQTEQATHKVLDMVEELTGRADEGSREIQNLQDLIPESVLKAHPAIKDSLNKLSININQNLDDSYNIMNALQFQDIISQQMDHAITLLDEVEDKLMSLLSTVGVSKDRVAIKDKKKRSFDPNASYNVDNTQNQQQEIDKIISNL